MKCNSLIQDLNSSMMIMKAWTAIDRLSIIWKSDLTDRMKRSFFQAAVISILLYGCTTWTLTKRLKKKLDGNYTRMLRAILNKSWRQHHTRHQLYSHLPPITKTIQVRRTRHAGNCWRSRDELISDVLQWTPHMAGQKQDDYDDDDDNHYKSSSWFQVNKRKHSEFWGSVEQWYIPSFHYQLIIKLRKEYVHLFPFIYG